MKIPTPTISGLFLKLVQLFCILGLLPLLISPAWGTDLLDMSFEDLLEIQVTAASRTPTRLMETAAAVSIVSREDIRRSGASTVPEALRMVPGVHVAQLSADRWAVTVRGFNGQVANKLLVMIDGRSIYTPTFSGVYWDALDVSLEEIERIEVIRGPGASLWGANAVNGVINIITSSALDTPINQATTWAGTKQIAGLSFLQTINQGDNNAIRLSVRGLIRDKGPLQGSGTGHDSQHGRMGLRWDLKGKHSALQTTASYYQGTNSATYNKIDLAPPFNTLLIDETDLRGGHIRTRFSHEINKDSTMDIQFYYDYTQRNEWLYKQEIQQLNLDLQHSTKLYNVHRLTWGANFGISIDYFNSRQEQVEIIPKKSRSRSISFFIQDDYALWDNLTLTFGTKYEYNQTTNWELQPNIRLLWQASPRLSLWGAVSRAVRTPSHVEKYGHVFSGINPPSATSPLPVLLTVQGNDDIDAEDLTAWELGSRYAVNKDISFDLAIFIHEYDNLQGGTQQTPSVVPINGVPAYIQVNHLANNNFNGHSYGAEIAVDWQVMPAWQLLLSYSYLDMHLRSGSNTEITMPELYSQHLLSLQSRWDISDTVQADSWLTYTDDIEAQDISPHWDLQLRLGWQPHPAWQVEIIGQNLIHDDKKELECELVSVKSSRSERGVFLRVNYKF